MRIFVLALLTFFSVVSIGNARADDGGDQIKFFLLSAERIPPTASGQAKADGKKEVKRVCRGIDTRNHALAERMASEALSEVFPKNTWRNQTWEYLPDVLTRLSPPRCITPVGLVRIDFITFP